MKLTGTELSAHWRRTISYAIAGTFLLIALSAFLPVMRIPGGQEIYGWDLMHSLQRLEDLGSLPLIGRFAESLSGIALKEMIRFFLAAWILSFALGIAESALALLLRGERLLLSSGLGVLVNLTLKLIVIRQMRFLNDQVHMEVLQVPMSSILVWSVFHVGILALVVWYLARSRMEYRKREEYRFQERLLIDEPFRKGSEIVTTDREFYGAIIGLAGKYEGKGYPMLRGETVFIGSTGGDDIPVDHGEEASLCQISFDEELKEYHVHPTARRCVHMKSGQPLGQHRLYCLPRGTEITISDAGDRFRLA
ncbi:MAG: hypothetical protein IJ109_07065 [Firmicutes bacterium]|nr:hypothetical protein [Bacillota bacterium]